jgi:hypothetical protein
VRHRVFVAFALLPLAAACGSSSKPAATPESTTLAPTTTTTATSVPASTTSTTRAVTTTTVACHGVGTTEPIVTATVGRSALLRAVAASGGPCADRVTFDFTTKENAPPKCTIVYTAPPFSMDGSGAPVTVAGSAFVRLRCEPAYGYDFATGQTTYTGPKRITATGTQHVKELVQTGDFEGVLSWVIGLDSERPFSAATATVPGPQARTRLAIRFY